MIHQDKKSDPALDNILHSLIRAEKSDEEWMRMLTYKVDQTNAHLSALRTYVVILIVAVGFVALIAYGAR